MKARIPQTYSLSKSEKKAMKEEISRQFAEYNKKQAREMDALILWVLHDKFGFGQSRLKKFYNEFHNSVNELIKRYELTELDDVWICTYMLKQYGIDINEWRNELDQRLENAKSEVRSSNDEVQYDSADPLGILGINAES